MTSNEILHADLLDIVFDNRNKAYGAYTLRKYYHNRLSLALGMTLSLALFLLLLLPPGKHLQNAVSNSGPAVTVTQVDIPIAKPKLPTPQLPHPTQPKAPVNTVKMTSLIHISDRPDIITEMPDQHELDKVAIGSADIKGVALSGPQLPPLTPGNGAGTAQQTEKQHEGELTVDQMPEFPGGMAAWTNFLSRNLRVPDDLAPGEKKSVMVAFKVAADGTVTGFRIMQSAGDAFDNEVIRVLKKMPKWKPALQHGTPIAVEFTQPVSFVASEQ